jgi:DNA modification methylase
VSASWRILQGDALERLRELPDASMHCCITSPPYFGLRDYGAAGQIGLEETPDEYVAALVAVFREVRRALRDDGTLWLNLGDSYAGSWGAQSRAKTSEIRDRGISAQQIVAHPTRASRTGAIRMDGVKPKDLYGVPWILAFALRADGWFLRSDIVWSKPNPMPESVTDRPTRSHEYVFLLSKSRRYYYDADAIREPAVTADDPRASDPDYVPTRERNRGGRRDGFTAVSNVWHPLGRNKRSVWSIATRSFRGAHFATFPPNLVEPCVLAGAAPKACGVCGAAYLRELGPGDLDESRPRARRAMELARENGLTADHLAAIRAAGISDAGKALVTTDGAGKSADAVRRLAAEAQEALGGYYREFLFARPVTIGWRPSCEHDDDGGRCVVLDPFAGAGTTGLVALRLDRSFVGIELNASYVELARSRILADAPLLNAAAEANA